ncbi:MAG: GNAT family N-acetyltransferase [Caldilinea sp.]|nr:GNAT family N-acetyltransferase [Caldilinea sp.]MDW8441507.1 GNAT family N-acetyltransferase [Caldilineaceae bacterium]
MQARIADRKDVGPVHRLLLEATRQQVDLAFDHIELAIQEQRCLVVERNAEDALLALLIFTFEETPAPTGGSALQRVYLQGMAFHRHVSPTEALRVLLCKLARMLEKHQPYTIIAYSRQSWLDRALRSAGMAQAERVEFFSLENLQRRQGPQFDVTAACLIRPAAATELDALTTLDACAFEPLWRYSRRQMQDALNTGPVLIAQVNDQLVGYMAFQFLEETCLLVRLAVHPDWRGWGIGRALFGAALLQAQRHGCTRALLNTQAGNQRAKDIYHAFGFRPTGESFAVFTFEPSILDPAISF